MVATDARTVCTRAVCILLECFLVDVILTLFTVNNIKSVVPVAKHFQISLFVNYVSCWRVSKRINCYFPSFFFRLISVTTPGYLLLIFY